MHTVVLSVLLKITLCSEFYSRPSHIDNENVRIILSGVLKVHVRESHFLLYLVMNCSISFLRPLFFLVLRQNFKNGHNHFLRHPPQLIIHNLCNQI